MHSFASQESKHSESLLEQPTGSHRVKYRGAGELSSWDFSLETDHRPIDLSLVLPHYRARNQPLDHRLSMYVGTERAESMKIKVCRNFMPSRSTKFHLEVHSSSSADITIWLPSDFKGHIHRAWHCKKVSFSAGFTNRVMQNACLTQSRRPSIVSIADGTTYRFSDFFVSNDDDELYDYGSAAEKQQQQQVKLPLPTPTFLNEGAADEDEVVVDTPGHVTFRMWDVRRGEPEARCRETCKRMLGLGWCAKPSTPVAIDWDFLLDD